MSVISNAPAITTTNTRTLRSDIIVLRDQLGSDPKAHEHGPAGQGCPDCLGCAVVASLEDALHNEEDRNEAPGRGRA